MKVCNESRTVTEKAVQVVGPWELLTGLDPLFML